MIAHHGLFRLLLLNDHTDSVNKLRLIIWDESEVRLLVIRVQEYKDLDITLGCPMTLMMRD